jgi:hypothetical protein
MANSYLNIITFLLTTLVYYLALKPSLKYDDMTNTDNYNNYLNSNKLYLAVYFFAILVIQFIVNAYLITQTCGGNITQNMSASGTFTFIPWSLIFGAVIVVLIVYPGFKSAFSDVVGYYYVAGSANKLLTELLVNKDIQNNIDADGASTAQQKASMQQAADMIIKICGNTSILINQIVPSNFVEYWNVLRPLMKPQYQTDGPQANEKRNELFELVVTRDNIGEAMWYIYTGILITSIVQLKIATRGCITDPEQMAKNYQNYLTEQKAAKKQEKQATSTVYTLSNYTEKKNETTQDKTNNDKTYKKGLKKNTLDYITSN